MQLAHGVRRAAIGRSGIKALKREGDGATPLGAHRIREVLYRPDRRMRPQNLLPLRRIGARDGWCDDPQDRNYNRPVRLPYGKRTESMKRDDALYDVVMVLGYNDRPRIKGRGSAIFIHLAREGFTPTEGCIAFSRNDMRAVLNELMARSTFLVAR